jgi:hypothetical protein
MSLGHIAKVLPVRLERCGGVTFDPDLIRIVDVQDVGRAGLAGAGQHPTRDLRQEARTELPWRNEVETELGTRVGRDAQRHAPGIAVGIGIGDEGECNTFASEHGHRGPEARPSTGEDGEQRPRKGKVARAGAASAAEGVDPADELRVQAEARGEGEAAAIYPSERDPLGGRMRESPRAFDRIAGETERTREDARRPTGDETHRNFTVEPVHGLVETAVARIDVDAVEAMRRLCHELDRVQGPLGQDGLDIARSGERLLDRKRELRGYAACRRIDDERRSDAASLGFRKQARGLGGPSLTRTPFCLPLSRQRG